MTALSEMMGISRQALYQQVKKREEATLCEELVVQMVHEIRRRMPRLGSAKLYRMLQNDLQKLSASLGRDKFHQMLKKQGLLVPKRKRTCHTTQSFHRFYVYKNLVKGLSITRKNQVLVADITYLRVGETFCYLFVLTDVYSRRILGFEVSESLSVEGALRTARMAMREISAIAGTIHHSDRGVQYCSAEYVRLMSEHTVQLSMGECGNPYDNAIAERVNGILKTEFFLDRIFATLAIARQAVREAIETYNTLRPHMSIEYMTPAMKYAA